MSTHPAYQPTFCLTDLSTEIEPRSLRWVIVDTADDDRPVAACTSDAALLAALRLLGGAR